MSSPASPTNAGLYMSRLNYQTHGDPSTPAILMLHGFMSCNGQWLTNLHALREHYFLITVELWGHGDSPLPSEPHFYSLDAYFHQFETIRADLQIERWALIGQSYGAGIMLHYAKAHPNVCIAVVATNSRSAFGQIPEDRPARRRGIPTSAKDLRKLPYHPIHARRFPQHVKDTLVAKADAMDREAVRLGGLLGTSLNSRKLVEDLPVPLLITNGRFEKHFQADLQSLRESAPGLKVIDLNGGHSVNIEAAEGFNTAVLEFLAEQ